MTGAAPDITVIIPHFDDRERMALCLDALARQTLPAARFEVIVVDNGSKDGVGDLPRRFPGVRFAAESAPGSYAARNAGIALARGEALAFTDSDCVPDPDWLAAGLEALRQHPGCGLVGGRVRTFARDPEQLNLAELYDSVLAFDQRRAIEQFHHSVTANLFTRREVMARVGPFDARMKSGGDYEWGQRVHRAGLSQHYAEAAIVGHPARFHAGELASKARRVAGGQFLLIRQRRRFLWHYAKWLRRLSWSIVAEYRRHRAHPLLAVTGARARFLAAILLVQTSAIGEALALLLGKAPERR